MAEQRSRRGSGETARGELPELLGHPVEGPAR